MIAPSHHDEAEVDGEREEDAACTLAESPSDPLHRKLRQLCCLGCRFDCYRVERTSSRAGVAPAGVQSLSRRTVSTARTNDRASS